MTQATHSATGLETPLRRRALEDPGRRLPRFSSAALKVAYLLTTLLCLPAAHARSFQVDEVTELLAELRSGRDSPPGLGRSWYFSMHGNACRPLRTLLGHRFEATSRICAELRTLASTPHDDELSSHERALIHALGFVKDPQALTWLEESLADGRRRPQALAYVRTWRTFLRGASHSESKWITNPVRWSRFFRAQYDGESDRELRTLYLRAMQGWLHDAETLAFFRGLYRDTSALTEERLLAATYLHQHGEAVDEPFILEAVRELRVNPEGARLLREFAEQIRHPAFVPFLIAQLRAGIKSAGFTLQVITFELDVSDPDDWSTWYRYNAHRTRKEWAALAGQEFLRRHAASPEDTDERLKFAIYRWKDPLFQPFALELAQHRELQQTLAGWINLTYRPHWRALLEEVAQKLTQDGVSHINRHHQKLLEQNDFLPGDEFTWEEHIEHSNSRM